MRILIALLLCSLVPCAAQVITIRKRSVGGGGGGGFPTGWARKCALVIDHTKVAADQTNMPVLIGYRAVGSETNLPQEMLVSGGSNAANSDGSDVRFTSDSSGTTGLAAEIVKWTQHASTDASRQAVIWVRIPSLSASVDTTIYVWYKNASATTPLVSDSTFGSQAVWSNGYLAAVHMEDNAASTTVLDSTSNAYNFTNQVNTSGKTATGKIGSALNYVRSSTDYSSRASISALNSDRTVSFWAKVSDTLTGMAMASAGNSATDGGPNWLLRANTQNQGSAAVYAGGYGLVAVGSPLYPSGTWAYINYTHVQAAGGVMNSYYNATLDVTGTGADTGGNNTNIYIGTGFSGAFDGAIDEFRVSSVARSATWISTEYANQSAPGTFITTGTPGAA